MPKTATSNITSLATGRSLRDARRKIGVSQNELATRLGVSPPYISGIENGRSNTTVGQLSAIADALGVVLEIGFSVPPRVPEPVIPAPPAQLVSR